MTNFDLGDIKALTWDVGGTVFDWHHTIKREIAALAETQSKQIDAAAFSNKWRFKMFELLQPVRKGEATWKNADELHLEALDIVLDEHDWSMTLSQRQDLNTVWHRLDAWPEAPACIENLRSRFQVTVLTVLSLQIAVSSSKHNQMSWDNIFSCEFLGHYKPDPEAYQKAASLLGLRPDQVMMCATHKNDLQSAADAGLRTAYIHIPDEHHVVSKHFFGADASVQIPTDDQFDVVAVDFPDLSTKLLA